MRFSYIDNLVMVCRRHGHNGRRKRLTKKRVNLWKSGRFFAQSLLASSTLLSSQKTVKASCE